MDETKGRKPKASPAHLPPGCDALLGREQVCSALGEISMMTFQRMLSTREFPAADTRLGVRPMWRVATVNAWIDAKSRSGE